ncbi:Uncharacterised protein [Serratia fonticola]|uniref:phage filamentation protein Fil family protein n=1 Tax=Serratia fonticola TaxID=47917 RepID=UPI002182D4A7|nr:phage filamentation protein Fil family protein [Serratia fonticola]CAI2121788.1 Uncharacterised protein [Serratia fonticola]
MHKYCPSLSTMLVSHQQITSHQHQCGWLTLPDGRTVQPKASEVKFIKGLDMPYMAKPRSPRRWFSRLMGIFA